ncbi:MAG: hypothetical protein PVI43_02855 [Candidatus Bathyarchaeota archaeon]|jgi:hypothetical protein
MQFFVPFLISGLILGTCTYVLSSYFPIPEPPEIPTTPDPTFVYEVLGPWIISLITTMVVLISVSGTLSWIMNSIVYGITTKTTSDQIETGTSSLGTSFNYTLSKLPTLLAAQFVAGILIVAGLLLFIVPGVIIAIMFSLIVPAVVVEGKGVFESLGRSRQLVHQRWGNTFVIMLICGLVVSAPLGVINAAASFLGVVNPVVTMIVGYVFTAFFGSILPIALTYLHYSMVARENSPPPVY